MKKIYHPTIQAQIDAYENQILRVQKELREEFERKMIQRTSHIQEALVKLHSENDPIRVEYDRVDLPEYVKNCFKGLSEKNG